MSLSLGYRLNWTNIRLYYERSQKSSVPLPKQLGYVRWCHHCQACHCATLLSLLWVQCEMRDARSKRSAGASGERGPGPPFANSSSAKKSSCFKMLHTIISRKPIEHCKILHYETSKSKKAFSFWGAKRPHTTWVTWPGALQMSIILSRTDNLRFLHS